MKIKCWWESYNGEVTKKMMILVSKHRSEKSNDENQMNPFQRIFKVKRMWLYTLVGYFEIKER